LKLLCSTILSIGIFQYSLQATEPYSFKHFDVANGLPSTEVYQAIQDSEGYMWFATDRGVSRYDGYRFTNFTRKDGLPDEVVFGLYLDYKKRLWFITYHGGLCYYQNGRFIEPSFNCELKDVLKGLDTPVLVSLLIDENDNIWLGNEYQDIIKISANGKIQLLFDNGKDEYIQRLIKVKSGNSHEFIFNGKKSWYLPDKIMIYKTPVMVPDTIYLPNDTTLQSFTSRGKYHKLNDSTFIFAIHSMVFKIRDNKVIQKVELGKEHRTFYALMQDNKKQFWVGTDNGIFCFPKTNLNKKPKYYLEDLQISSVYQDMEGGYWFTTLVDGIYYLPHFHIRSIARSQLGGNRAIEIMANSHGIYVGCRDEDLLVLPHGDYKKLKIFPGMYVNESQIINYNDEILVKSRGNLLSFKNDTVPFKNLPYTKKYFQLKHFDDQSEFSYIYKPDVITIIQDETDSVWARFKHNYERGLTCATVSSDMKHLWLGYPTGLKLLHKNGKVENLRDRFEEFAGRITDLDIIDHNLILVTTRGYGVLKYNYADQTLQKLDGIPNEYCQESYVDAEGVVWVASFSGVTRIDGVASDQPSYNHFSTHNGLVSNEVYHITEFKDYIWVATANGLSYWHRNWLPQNNPPVDISRMIINGEAYDLNSNDILLSHRNNNLEFFFNTISFRKPVEYQYRLKGLHANWISTNGQRAVYKALKPGNYTLEVRPAYDKNAHSSVAFTITSPLWLNFWFWTSMVALVMIITFFLLRIRYRIIKRENKLYELFTRSEQKALRAQINPHFLFNTFNSILELLAEKDYASVQVYMQRFSRLMRIVLQQSREEEISLQEEIEFLTLYLKLEKLRFGALLSFTIEVDPDLELKEAFLPSLLLQPYVENALKHGVRSRKDGDAFLQVSFRKEKELLIVRIKDNGVGYSPSTITGKLTKNRSYGMKINGERIQLFNQKKQFKIIISDLDKDNAEYPGTVVELYFPLKINKHYETTVV